ncbi:hypothetical protein KC356_g4538 [Hortaea werneckii]|nr:hypothetical protein KC356_g4538 [Hortaea werneckii]
MAPKRSKQAAPSASQPLPESSRPTRTSNRKRRHSDASNASEATSQASTTTPAPAKRRRKGKSAANSASAEPEVIVEETEQEGQLNDHHQQSMQLGGDATVEHEAEESIEVTQPRSKHVAFASGAGSDGATATHATPFPKMTVKRHRISASPAVSTTKRLRFSGGRSSLPPTWSQDEDADPREIIRELQFAPLRSVLDERIRQRRLEREGNFEHDGERSGALTAGGDDFGEDMLILNGTSQDDIDYPALPTHEPSQSLQTTEETDGDTKAITRELSQSTRSRISLGLSQAQAQWDAERKEFQDAVLAFQKEANDAKARLTILSIELKHLGFGGEDEDALTILKSIRASFDEIRGSIEETLPDTVPEDASTKDIVEILIANVREFAERLRIQDKEMHEKESVIVDLSKQIRALLDRLADAEITRDQLKEECETLRLDNNSLTDDAQTLESNVQSAEDDITYLHQQLDEKTEQHTLLTADHADVTANLEKLKVSLDNYRKEEGRLSLLIEQMEKEHRETVTAMNKEREETVHELESKYDEEASKRTEAEQQADERQTEVTRLELLVEDLTGKRDELTAELDIAKADREAADREREEAEASLEERNGQVEELEARVDRLEEELSQVTSEIEELRASNDSQSRQREAAERDLDDRNAQVEALEEKLRHSGKEANDLRMKLFGAQQDHTKKVKELEKAMSDREQQYNTDVAAEVARRQEADELAAERAVTIKEIEAKLAEVESRMLRELAARDQTIADLEADLKEREEELEGMRNDYRALENEKDILQTNAADEKESLEGTIEALQGSIDQKTLSIQEMQEQASKATELHNSETDDRNREIANLHARITSMQTRVNELEHAKAGLESRVESEAMAMLDLQNSKQDEIDHLHTEIRNQHAKILVVEEKAREADASWQDVVEARDAKILSLEQSASSEEEAFESLTVSFEEQKRKFMQFARNANATIARLQDAVASAKVVVDEEGDAMMAEGNGVLEELESLDVVGEMKVMRKSSSTTRQSGTAMLQQGGPSSSALSQTSAGASSSAAKKGKGKKGKRAMDSGIGMEAEEYA